MPYNFGADSFHIKKLCSRLLPENCQFLDGKWPFYVFEPPPWGDLGATYDVHFRLIGKRVVDFLLVIMVLFAR